jgi:hypothetical protein
MDYLDILNNNKYLSALTMIFLNIGSKYMAFDISENQEKILKSNLVRRIVLFSIFYVATKDLLLSLTFTTIFIILTMTLINENSKLCLLPKKISIITQNQYKNALQIVKKYESLNAKILN